MKENNVNILAGKPLIITWYMYMKQQHRNVRIVGFLFSVYIHNDTIFKQEEYLLKAQENVSNVAKVRRRTLALKLKVENESVSVCLEHEHTNLTLQIFKQCLMNNISWFIEKSLHTAYLAMTSRM